MVQIFDQETAALRRVKIKSFARAVNASGHASGNVLSAALDWVVGSKQPLPPAALTDPDGWLHQHSAALSYTPMGVVLDLSDPRTTRRLCSDGSRARKELARINSALAHCAGLHLVWRVPALAGGYSIRLRVEELSTGKTVGLDITSTRHLLEA